MYVYVYTVQYIIFKRGDVYSAGCKAEIQTGTYLAAGRRAITTELRDTL
jgi:hypothetical protein